MSVIRISCEDHHIEFKVSKEDVFVSERREEWLREEAAVAFKALFSAIHWTEGPVAMMRRLLAEHPEASEEDRASLETSIAHIKAHREQHGDAWEGRDD